MLRFSFEAFSYSYKAQHKNYELVVKGPTFQNCKTLLILDYKHAFVNLSSPKPNLLQITKEGTRGGGYFNQFFKEGINMMD